MSRLDFEFNGQKLYIDIDKMRSDQEFIETKEKMMEDLFFHGLCVCKTD